MTGREAAELIKIVFNYFHSLKSEELKESNHQEIMRSVLKRNFMQEVNEIASQIKPEITESFETSKRIHQNNDEVKKRITTSIDQSRLDIYSKLIRDFMDQTIS